MVAATTGRHLTSGALYDFLKRKLAPGRQARLDRHVAACARCRRMAEEGRELMAWLEDWSIDSINLTSGRILLRQALRQASRAESVRSGDPRQLARWQGTLAYAHAVLLTLEVSGRKGEGLKIGGCQSMARKGTPAEVTWQFSPAGPVPPLGPSQRQAKRIQVRAVLQVTKQNELILRCRFAPDRAEAPWVMLIAGRSRKRPDWRRLRKVPGGEGVRLARFVDLAPGPYILALQPPASTSSSSKSTISLI